VKAIVLRVAALFLIAWMASLAAAQSGPRDRIASRIDNRMRTPLAQGLHRLARPDFDQGPVSDDLPINRAILQLSLSAAQQQDLDQFLKQLSDPSSPNYHRWLTPEQFGARFGATQADLDKLTAWLESQGLQLESVPAGRNHIIFSGTAAALSSAFQTEIHQYLVNGETHYANAQPVSVPTAFSGVVQGLHGLHDFRLKPRAVKQRAPDPQYTYLVNGSHYLTPADVATIYNLKGLYSATYTGAGQKIAVVEQTNIYLSNVENFRVAAGLVANDPQMVLGGTDPGYVATEMDEAYIDVEWSGAVAPNATIIYVYSTDVFDSLQYAVSQNLAPVISISYGECEASAVALGDSDRLKSIGQQANAQGQTIVAASGDTGAADCDDGTYAKASQGLAVDMPASLPYVTGVGGTEFNEGNSVWWSASNTNGGSALSYIPEKAWNDSDSYGLSASGGGVSTLYAKPLWQAGPGVPGDGMRDVPDVSFSASTNHDGYVICQQSKCLGGGTDYFANAIKNGGSVYGGTSFGAPIFAGIVALINQKMGSPQGNVNPVLYALAAGSPSAFHDITLGNNIVSCRSSSPNCSNGTLGYSAAAGYDLVTGLGSVDAAALGAAWSAFETSVSAPTVTTTAASSIGTTSATVNGSVNPNGSLTTYWFQWGTDPALGTSSSTAGATLNGVVVQPVSTVLSGLTSGGTYFFRVAAYNPMSPATNTLGNILSFAAANLTGQTITFTGPGTQTYGVAPITLTATASSGLTVSYSVTSGPATVNGSTLTITGAGQVTVQASQAGNSTYAAAPPVPVTFSVSKAASVLTWAAPAAITYGTALSSTQLNATASVPGTFAYSPPTGTVLSAAPQPQSLSVTFTPADATDYNPASASVSLTVNKASPTITVSASILRPALAAPVTLTASVPNGGSGSVTFYDGLNSLGTGNISGATATFTTSSLASGAHSITANWAGDTNYNAATSAAIVVTVLTAQTITFPSPGTQMYGVAPITLTATASSGLTVSYAVTAGPATVSGSTLTITGAGQVTVQAAQAGNAQYASAPSVSVTFTVNQTSQTISFPSPGTQTYGVAPITLTATASSGLTVSYAVTAGPATVSGRTLTITGAGQVTVQAAQAGNLNFLNAPPVSVTFSVNQASQTISFPSPGTQTYGVAPITLTATASSGLTVSYAVTAGPATVSGSTLTITGAGQVTVQAAQAGNLNFLNATPVSVTFTVLAAQTITFANPGTQTYGVAPITLTATASSGLAVSYAVTAGPATVSGSTLTITGAGQVTVQAAQAGTSQYASAPPVSVTFAVQDFSLPLNSPTVTLPAGQTVTTIVAVSSVSGFAGTVSFTCAVPATMSEASCAASSVQVTPTTGASSTVTVTTTAPHQVSARSGGGKAITAALGMVLAAVVFAGFPRNRRRGTHLLMLLVLLGSMLMVVCCGGGSSSSGGGGTSTRLDPGTPAGTYSLTLTAKSGTATHTMSVSATVQ